VVIIEQPQKQPVYAPVVNSFTANPGYIHSYETVVLTWTVSNADTVTLSPGIGSVPNSGSYNVSPGYTTTYTLSATNNAGSVSASTTVTVVPYASALNTSIGTQVISDGSVVNAGASDIVPLGFGGGDGPFNSWPPYVLLIGLLVVAGAVIAVFLVKKPAVAYAGRRASAPAGYMAWATDTPVATRTPQTTPIDAGTSAKFVTPDGGHVSASGNVESLGRNDFQSFVMPDEVSLISREHIRVECENGKYYIEDRNSTNGTRINGSRITGKGRFLLREGDVIELADVLTIIFKT
jgi:hypothetical protein